MSNTHVEVGKERFLLFLRQKAREWRWIAETGDYHVRSRKFTVETDARCSARVESDDRAHVYAARQLTNHYRGLISVYAM